MPITPLVEGSTFDEVCPTPDDGDGATGPGLDGFALVLANRTRYLRAILETTGISKIAKVADYTALKAITVSGALNGQTRQIPGIGIYYFDGALSVAEDLPWHVNPASGAGCWVNVIADVIGAYVPTMDPGTGKVVQPVPNRIVADYQAFDPSYATNLLMNAAAPPGFIVSATDGFLSVPSVVTGDKLKISATAMLTGGGTTNEAYLQLRIVDAYGGSAVTTDYPATRVKAIGTNHQFFPFNIRHTALASGTTRIQLALAGDGAANGILRSPYSIHAFHIRP